ncbi:hypothetical protein HMPREF1981_03065 [Bacteroides pyogenes F0041]|uniref:Uncharacterized protein n=1 Tax=Bacteroides pyogenes F0041 TaxID=1321819 RepID=U2DPP7_9BACE|nr:hypothetical protein HMPREF1981_03065 [Bacteroides pyogenes F0041]
MSPASEVRHLQSLSTDIIKVERDSRPFSELRHLQPLSPNDFEIRATIGGKCSMNERQLQVHTQTAKEVNTPILLGFSALFRIFAF